MIDNFTKFREKIEAILDNDPITKYLIIITSIISLILVIEAWVDGPQKSGIFISLADKQFIQNFVEWFGVIYGFVWSTIIVKVWEQSEKLNNIFDREVDAIQLLVEDLRLLDPIRIGIREEVLNSLNDYVYNVYQLMIKKLKNSVEEGIGNDILTNIRAHFSNLLHPQKGVPKESEVLLGDILTQINTIVDNRSDRISLLSQTTVRSLKQISLITSIVWLAPFYFLDYTDYTATPVVPLQFGLFGRVLVISVTFLVIIIMSILDDLNTPFDGYWTTDKESWTGLKTRIELEIEEVKKMKSELESGQPQKQKIKNPRKRDLSPVKIIKDDASAISS